MRSDLSPVDVPLAASGGSWDPRARLAPLRSARRSRSSAAPPPTAAERSAARTGASRPVAPARPSPATRGGDAERPTPPSRPATGERPTSAATDRDDVLRDRTLLVAVAAAICAVAGLALLPGVPSGIAVVIGFVPSLAGGWLFLTLAPRNDAGPSPTLIRAGGALVVAHAIAVVPVAAAVLLAG